MFELTNAQRKYFALSTIEPHWECITVKQSPYDLHETLLYLDGDTVVKCLMRGENLYCEYDLCEAVTHDRTLLLPKTAKGKPVRLSATSIAKRNGVGMRLQYRNSHISLYNAVSECAYFSNCYLTKDIHNIGDFAAWVEKWCEESTADNLADIARFAKQKRRHIAYHEGDVFRFAIGRRMYGYGRILLDYDKMRRNHEVFWDILMMKPLVCSVYHIMAERDDVTVDELKGLRTLPSVIMADNRIYYGEYGIIGNIPVTDDEDYPIMYGNSITAHEKAVCYQCGKTFIKMENAEAIDISFRNNGVGVSLKVTADVLGTCIAEQSNAPYWAGYYAHTVKGDLRNPANADILRMIRRQMGLQDMAERKYS